MRRCASDAQKLEQLRRLIREIEYLKYTLNSTWSIIFPGRRTLHPKFPQWFEG